MKQKATENGFDEDVNNEDNDSGNTSLDEARIENSYLLPQEPFDYRDRKEISELKEKKALIKTRNVLLDNEASPSFKGCTRKKESPFKGHRNDKPGLNFQASLWNIKVQVKYLENHWEQVDQKLLDYEKFHQDQKNELFNALKMLGEIHKTN